MVVKWEEEKQEDADNFVSGSCGDASQGCLHIFTSGLSKCSEAIGQYTNYIRRENRKVINPSLKVFKVHVCRVTSKPTEAWSPGSGGGVPPKDTDSGS